MKQCGLKFKAMCWNLWSWVQALWPTSHWICSCLPPYQFLSCTLYRANLSASYQLGFKYHVFSQIIFVSNLFVFFRWKSPFGERSIKYTFNLGTYEERKFKNFIQIILWRRVDRELSNILNKCPFVCTVYIQFIQLQTCQARQTKLAC